MMAVFHALEVAAHVVGRPRAVAGQVGDVVPVGVVRRDGDHRVVRRASTERAGARIENAVDGLAVERVAVLRILLLQRLGGVVTDEEVPLHRRVLTGEAMKHRHVIVAGQAIFTVGLRFSAGIAAARRNGIATSLEQQHLAARFRQPRGHRAAAGSRADHNVLVLCLLLRVAHGGVFSLPVRTS